MSRYIKLPNCLKTAFQQPEQQSVPVVVNREKRNIVMKGAWSVLLLFTVFLSSCGKEAEQADRDTAIATGAAAGVDEGGSAGEENTENNIDAGGDITSESNETDTLKDNAWKEKFGENCIGAQTFEVELSEYQGKVYFVPFAPTENQRDFSMQIIQDGKVLTEIEAYVPDILSGQSFGSLDAVAFYDVNYDGKTDIVLIETYSNTTYAAVYYGYTSDTDENRSYFMVQEELSDNISKQVEQLTIPEIRNFLSDGKKNGEFADYREAYEAVGRLCELENTWEMEYNLIYFDADDIPEFVAGHTGYYVSMYAYHDGKIYILMDRWPYGAGGNMGYEYAPRKNNLRNYNSDYGGAIHYTTYMSVNDRHVMDTIVQSRTVVLMM